MKKISTTNILSKIFNKNPKKKATSMSSTKVIKKSKVKSKVKSKTIKKVVTIKKK